MLCLGFISLQALSFSKSNAIMHNSVFFLYREANALFLYHSVGNKFVFTISA